MAYLPGDIVLYGGHTSMIVADRGNQMLDVVHATAEEGVVRYTKYLDPEVAEEFNQTHEGFVANSLVSGDVYRCTSRGTTVAPIAAKLGEEWTLPMPSRKAPMGAAVRTAFPKPSTTELLDDRSKGVWAKETTSPPFEFDALFRTLKWAATHDHAFSEHRGATCSRVRRRVLADRLAPLVGEAGRPARLQGPAPAVLPVPPRLPWAEECRAARCPSDPHLE